MLWKPSPRPHRRLTTNDLSTLPAGAANRSVDLADKSKLYLFKYDVWREQKSAVRCRRGPPAVNAKWKTRVHLKNSQNLVFIFHRSKVCALCLLCRRDVGGTLFQPVTICFLSHAAPFVKAALPPATFFITRKKVCAHDEKTVRSRQKRFTLVMKNAAGPVSSFFFQVQLHKKCGACCATQMWVAEK